MTIVSDPPGALVKIDDNEIGTTPVSTDFTFYGTRKFQLIKDGYETLTVLQPIPAPWYQYPVLDFFSDNLAMHEIHDSRLLSYQLQPMIVSPTEEIIQRGENLRNYGQAPPHIAPAGAISYGPSFPVGPHPSAGPGSPAGTLPPPGIPSGPNYAPPAGLPPAPAYGPGSTQVPPQNFVPPGASGLPIPHPLPALPPTAPPYGPQFPPAGGRLPL